MKLLHTFLSFYFRNLLFTTLLVVVFCFDFILFISATTSACCKYSGIAETSFEYFLPFLPTNTKSISVLFPPVCMLSIFPLFLNQVFATYNSFSSQNSSNISPSTFLLPKHFLHATSNPTIRFLTCPLKSFKPEIIQHFFSNYIHIPVHHKIAAFPPLFPLCEPHAQYHSHYLTISFNIKTIDKLYHCLSSSF